MKITDNLETAVHDPVVERGDILKVAMGYNMRYFIVAKRAGNSNPSNVLIDLTDGGNWTAAEIPLSCHLSFYANHIFSGFGTVVAHVPSDKVELVIGG